MLTVNKRWRIPKGNQKCTIQRTPKGQLKMDSPEKLATQCTQDEEKYNKETQIM